MERFKKVGTRPAQWLDIVLGERTEQNETIKKSRNTPSSRAEHLSWRTNGTEWNGTILKKVETRPAPLKKVMEERNLWMKRKKQNVQRRRKTRMEL